MGNSQGRPPDLDHPHRRRDHARPGRRQRRRLLL